MNIFSKIIKGIEDIPGAIEGLFTKYESQIHAAIADAQTAASAGIAVAATLGDSSAATEIAKISNGLTAVSAAVTSAATSTTLTAQANTLGTLVTGLVNSGDLNIKSTATQAAVDNVVTKAQQVIGALIVATATPAA